MGSRRPQNPTIEGNANSTNSVHGMIPGAQDTIPGAEWFNQVPILPVDQFRSTATPVSYAGNAPVRPGLPNEHTAHYPEPNFLWSEPYSPSSVQSYDASASQPLEDRISPAVTPNTPRSRRQKPVQLSQDFEDETMPIELSSGPDRVLFGVVHDLQPGNPRATLAAATTPASRSSGRKKKIGRRGGWSQGLKLGPRGVQDPGEPFNTLRNDALRAFLDEGNNEEARRSILEAIKINPEIHAAHVLLSQIYDAMGEPDNAMAALYTGAHASPNNSEAWWILASRCQEIQESPDEKEREAGLKGAVYTYSRLLGIDRHNHEARFEKAKASRALGHPTKALKDLDYLLKLFPGDANVRQMIAEVCLDVNDVSKAKIIYEDRLDQYADGTLADEWDMFWADLIIYIDIIDFDQGHAEALDVLKEYARWYVGRGDETFWIDFPDDDREWDAEDHPRRLAIQDFVPGHRPLDVYGPALPMELRIKLGTLRLRLGSRKEALQHFEWLQPEDFEEGAPVYDYPDLFLSVADSLREIKEHKEALRYYQALVAVNAYESAHFWLGIGASSYVCGDKIAALQYYENAKAADPSSGEARTQLSKLYADKGDRARALTNAREAISIFHATTPTTQRRRYERREAREARQEAERALRGAYRIPLATGEKDPGPAPSFSRRAQEKARKASRVAQDAVSGAPETDAESISLPLDRESRLEPETRKRRQLKTTERTREDRQQNIQHLYSSLSKATKGMRDGEDEARAVWMDCAEDLIGEFRSEKAFYSKDKSSKVASADHSDGARDGMTVTSPPDQDETPIRSIESALSDEYCGLTFLTWLDIFLEYALLLANLQCEPAECYTIISGALDCTVWFHNPATMAHIHTCYLACTLVLQDESTLYNTVLRWFMREYAFCSDAYRLFSALNFYYPYIPDKAGKDGQMSGAKFRASATQKFILRHITTVDAHLPDTYGVDTPDGPVPAFMRDDQRKSVTFANFSTNDKGGSDEARALPDDTMTVSSSASGLVQNNASNERVRTFQPKELDPILLTMYAQVLYAGGSFPNAISYLYRALAVSPDHPTVLLTLALCYLHSIFRRQNENRHMYLLHGWALLEKYAQVRIEWAEAKERQTGQTWLVWQVRKEIEFNKSRCWHMLGMADLALRGYQTTINMRPLKREPDAECDHSDVEGPDEHDLSMDAAYAMVVLYATNGDVESARQITERHLVVE